MIVGSAVPAKKVLNSQRPRPAKPLGPRALRIPPSQYSRPPKLRRRIKFFLTLLTSLFLPRSTRSTPSSLPHFSSSNYRHVWTHQKQKGGLSGCPVSAAVCFSFRILSISKVLLIIDHLLSITGHPKTHPLTTPPSPPMPKSLEFPASKKVLYIPPMKLSPCHLSPLPAFVFFFCPSPSLFHS